MVSEATKNARPIYKNSTRKWALSNYGNIWSVHRTRKEAREEAERNIGKPWAECGDSMEIRKMTLVEGWR